MALNMFVKFTGPEIVGSSTRRGHETWIEVHSWNHGFHQPTSPIRSSAGGGTVETAQHSHFTFTKEMDVASDDLIKMCWTGQHIDGVKFVAYRDSGDVGADQKGVPYITVEFESAIVADYSVSGGLGQLPHESVSLNYQKVTYIYNGQDIKEGVGGGNEPVSHDLKSNVVA